MTQTALDRAHADMTAAPDDDTLRLRFFERLGDAELFLLLETEPDGETVAPQVFDPGSGAMVLVFDREYRLAAFVGGAAPFASMSGRTVLPLLSEQGLGLGLNLDVAPSSFLLDGAGVQWLAETLSAAPDQVDAHLQEIAPPAGLPPALLEALDAKLATATGLAQLAYLAATKNDAGGQGHLLAFVGAVPGAEDALAQAVSEALVFSGLEAAALDVGFFDARAPLVARLARAGLRFDLPQPAPAAAPAPPGTNPDAPPRLR